MKVIKTAEFEKLSYGSVDDQPGFVNRDHKGQGTAIYVNPLPSSVQEVQDEWVKPKKRRSPKKEEMPKESL